MAALEELIDLFSKLAFHIQTLPDSTSIDLSISKLSQSLNLTGNTQTRVLDTALSLMCFKAPQVFDCMIEHLVKTIASVLCSSITCNVLRFDKEEVLQIGSSISQRNFVEFIEVVNDVVSQLHQRGMPSHLFLSAVGRVAVSASSYKCLVPSMRMLDTKSIYRKWTGISNLLSCLPKEFSLNHHEIPSRLLSWYLDPLTLKLDVSNILQDIMERPFLSLSKEFYERMEWRSILICLVLSPTMFIRSKALLHNWFILTGLGSILELLSELVLLILDVISRPTWWGISMEMGSKLPCSDAYFPFKSHILRILAGPLSSSSFLQLVHVTRKSVFLIREQIGPTCKPSAVKVASIDSKSAWALAICFPDWFYFASVLLFSNHCFQNNIQPKSIFVVPKFGQTSDMEQFPASAARYIAWILSPNNQSQQDMLFDSFTKLSEFWALRQIDYGTSGRDTASSWKRLNNSKSFNGEEDLSLGTEYDIQVIGLWLKEFQNIMKYDNKSIKHSHSSKANSHIFACKNHMFFRRIPLGILIGCPCYVNEDGFELLLHYAATGRMLHLISKNSRMDSLKQNRRRLEDLVLGSNECSKKEALVGAFLVFSLTDIVERMSASLFEDEKCGLDSICQVKLRASKYLIKCLKRLIQLNIDEDGDVMQLDLHGRLERWRHQGQELSKIDKDLDDAIKGLSHEILPF